MTDIIFKTNITQPASNVANLNFVDDVITLNANSIVKINAECSFNTFSVTAVMSKIELKPVAVFTELVPLDVFDSKQLLVIIPAIGFKVIHQGDGDPYFENVKLLSHFNKLLGNGGFYDEKNRERGLDYDNAFPKNFFDADSRITYVDDNDSFDGNVVSTGLYHHFIFGDYIEPVNPRYSLLLTTEEQNFYSYKSFVQSNFQSSGNDLTKKSNVQGAIKTYQEWFDYFSALEKRCEDFVLLNGVQINIADYRGDYGKSLSVRGKDWCLESRFKITGKDVVNEYKLENDFNLFSTREIKLNVSINYIQNSLGEFDLKEVFFDFYPSVLNTGWYIRWRVTELVVNSFTNLKLVCANGKYDLILDGILIHQIENRIYDKYNDFIYVNSIGLIGSPADKLENYEKFNVSIDYPLPCHQLFGIPVVPETFKLKNEIATEEKLANIVLADNFVKINKLEKYKVYKTKTKLPDVNDKTLVGQNYALDLISNFGITRVLVTTDYIEIFFNQEIIVEGSVKFYFFPKLNIEFKADLEALILNKKPNVGYGFYSNLIYRGDRPIITVKKGSLEFSYTAISGEITKQSAKITYVDGLNKDVIITLPVFEYVNNDTSFDINFSETHANNPIYQYKNDYDLCFFYELNGLKKAAEYKIITDYTDNLNHTIYGYDVFYNAYVMSSATSNITSNREACEHLGEVSVVDYTYRDEIGIKPEYCFGIDRFNVTKNSVEIIFDDTFVEHSVKFDVPFDMSYLGEMNVANNYKIYVSVLNNTFIVDIELYEISYYKNGIKVSGGSAFDDVKYEIIKTFSEEFTATVNKWDSQTYNKNYNNQISIESYNLDEMRFTVGNSRIYEYADLSKPFPNFLENRMEFNAQFDVSATFQFGSNNLIKIEPNSLFKNFTKKPKDVVITPIKFEVSQLSSIELLPLFSFSEKIIFEFINKLSIISSSAFYLLNDENHQTIPPETPIVISKETIIELLATIEFIGYLPVNFESESEIEIKPVISFAFINPIRFEPQSSEISIFVDLNLKQIKTELIYLPADNRSKASTGFVDKLLYGIGVASIFDNGTIEFYTGNRPYSANHAVTGTLLGVLSNIKFGIPLNRIIRKDESQTWLLMAISSGQIGWFRIKANATSDYGQDSIREVRLDGEAGDAEIDFIVKAGDYYHIQDFAVMWGNG